jgi:hypothetical protein
VPAGTNGDEVIAETQTQMRRVAREAVEKLFVELDNAVFEQLTKELRRLRRQVDHWRELSTPQRLGDTRPVEHLHGAIDDPPSVTRSRR